MDTAEDLHERAMELAALADAARSRGDVDGASNLFSEAFRLAAEAADFVAPAYTLEPTRGILHRSAATLAIDAGKAREARELAHRGLKGQTPAEVREELQEVIRRAEAHELLIARAVSEGYTWRDAVGCWPRQATG